MKEIPVLLYHNMGHYPVAAMEDGLHPESFEQQMGFLAENGYNVVPLKAALDHLSGRIKLPPRSIAVTIDGGYRDAYTDALPVLKRYKLHATFFVVPRYLGGAKTVGDIPIPCLSWNELRVIADAGMGVGLLMYEGRGIKRLYNEQAVKDSVSASLKVMKENFDGHIEFCAVKEGVPKKSLWDFLKVRGFKAVFTQCPTNQRTTPAGIGRIQIDDDDHNIFLTKISPMYLFFKDKRSWKYIRRYKVDRLAHRISETVNRIRGNKQV
ncbi:MAG: polysaccharide deacetylase family protein [Deltaproteobacteria bacterium]|nr:polysaccharide deacetylase family protein [Deltaproteobacteria bacterium]MBN2688423.1 polysaccharide deacetylase family protein [Deltaproteobacteria bacterium]